MPRYVKPTAKSLLAIADKRGVMPYQYVNYWAYTKGIDTMIRDVYDQLNPLYIYATMNQGRVLEDLAESVKVDLSGTLYGRIQKTMMEKVHGPNL